MKRPRRPVKARKPRKVAKPKVVKIAKPKDPVFNLKIGTREDPLHVDPATIPPGVALQWISEGDEFGTGWRSVPSMRPVKGNVLLWAPIEVAETQHLLQRTAAQEQMRVANELFQINDWRGFGGRREGRSFPLVSPSFMVSSDYKRIPADAQPLQMVIPLPFVIPVSWQDAAAALALTPQEYARRRLIMQEDLVLVWDFGAYSSIKLSFNKET